MALRAAGAESWLEAGHGLARQPYLDGGKRRISHSDGSDYVDHDALRSLKRSRVSGSMFNAAIENEEPIPAFTYPFLVLRESTSPLPEPAGGAEATSSAMERTESGLSISSDSTIYTSFEDNDHHLLDDDKAAWLVEQHLLDNRRKVHRSRHERILRSLIRPRSRDAEFSIDNAAMESIFSAANEVFFSGRLSRRVTWDWSHSSSAQYQNQIIGTTALRRSRLQGGFETLIVLSHPILNDKKYNRRLLISTFLHELIHSYLFICCGFKARHRGGHTPGFRRIAELIDQWAGSDTLHLQNMEADLDDFKERDEEENSTAGETLQGYYSGHASHLPSGHDHTCARHYPPSYHQHHYHNSRHHQVALETRNEQDRDEWDIYVAGRREHIARIRHDTCSTPPLSHVYDPPQGVLEVDLQPVRWVITPDQTAITHGRFQYELCSDSGTRHSTTPWARRERVTSSQSPLMYPSQLAHHTLTDA